MLEETKPKEIVEEKPIEKVETKANRINSYPTATEKFRRNYPRGVCKVLFEAGAVQSIKTCTKEAAPEAAIIASNWEKGYTAGMKRFLGIK